MADHSRPTMVDRFERAFVLSTSRALFLVVAVLAALALFGGGAAFAWSMAPPIRGGDPPMPPEPSSPEVTLADVLAVLDAPADESEDYSGDFGEPSFVAAELAASGDIEGSEAARFAELATRLASFFDTTRYPWLSEMKTVCTYRAYRGQCFNWDTRVDRKGVVDILNDALPKFDRADQVPLLQAMVDLMPLCSDEDTRFVAIGTVVDVVSATKGADSGTLSALRSMLAGPPVAEGQPAQLLPSATAQEYMGGILRARKRGAPPELVREWILAIPRLHARFGYDMSGNPNRVEGLVATWQALQGTLPELAGQRIEGISAIAAAAPEGRRPEVVRAYGDLVRARASAAQRDYEDQLQAREFEIARLDAEVAASKEKKAVLRVTASSIVGTAFAVIAGVGLLLALLAVERNTRATRELLGTLRSQASPPLPPSAPASAPAAPLP